MENNTNKITFWRNWWQLMQNRDTPEKRLAFIEAVLGYAFEGKTPNMKPKTGVEYAALDGFLFVQNIIDAECKNFANGRKGGRPPKNGGRKDVPEAAQTDGGEQQSLPLDAKPEEEAAKPPEAEKPPQKAERDDDDGTPPEQKRYEEAARNYRVEDDPMLADPRTHPSLDAVLEAGRQSEVPEAFCREFHAEMSKRGWNYTSQGKTVFVRHHNVKSTLYSFWQFRSKKRRGDVPATTRLEQTGYRSRLKSVVLKTDGEEADGR